VKSGKAAGFDGVYPEFIKNSGQRTKEWIVAFFNDILKSVKFRNWSSAPKLLRSLNLEKMVLILRTFTAQYRFQDT
jgi:hypothetical protein